MNIRTKIYWFAALFAATGVFSACTSNDDANEENIVSDKYLVVDSKKSVKPNSTMTAIEVLSNCKWRVDYKVVNDIEWPGLNIDPMSGEGPATVIVTTNANDTELDRSVDIKFIAEDEQLNQTCTVTQTVGEFVAKLTLGGDDKVTVDYEGKANDNQGGYSDKTGDFTIVIEECNTSWSATVETSDGGAWCELKDNQGKKEGKFTISFMENSSKDERKATVKIITTNTAGTPANASVVYTQDGALTPSADVEKPEIGKDGVTVTIKGTVNSRNKYDLIEYGYIITSVKNKAYSNYKKKMSVDSSESLKKTTFTDTIKLDDGYDYEVKAYATTKVGTTEGDSELISLKGDEPDNDDNPWQPLSRDMK